MQKKPDVKILLCLVKKGKAKELASIFKKAELVSDDTRKVAAHIIRVARRPKKQRQMFYDDIIHCLNIINSRRPG